MRYKLTGAAKISQPKIYGGYLKEPSQCDGSFEHP